MNARMVWGLLAMAGVAGLGFLVTRVAAAQPPQRSSIIAKTQQSSAGYETTMTLNPGTGVQGIKWAVFYRGEIIGGGNASRDKPERLEPITLVYNFNSRFATKGCPIGGFLVNGITMCSRKDSSYDPYFDLSIGRMTPTIASNRWIPTFNVTTRAGAQAKNGTTDAIVLWVMFETPDLSKASADPPMKYRPNADYFKP